MPASKDPTILIRSKPLDHAPKERLERFAKALQETAPEDSLKLLQAYLDPDAPTYRGRVSMAVNGRVGVAPWQESMSRPGASSFATGGIRSDVPGGQTRYIFNEAPLERRDPQTRVESLTRRYVAEWKKGNTALLDGLLKEVVGEYWKSGSPVTEDALRMLAAKSLQEAEDRQKQRHYKRTTRPVIR